MDSNQRRLPSAINRSISSAPGNNTLTNKVAIWLAGLTESIAIGSRCISVISTCFAFYLIHSCSSVFFSILLSSSNGNSKLADFDLFYCRHSKQFSTQIYSHFKHICSWLSFHTSFAMAMPTSLRRRTTKKLNYNNMPKA